jgi:cob(I)alamin adenosyltransferase
VDHLWTGKGDDGTTGLYYGGRVRKDSGEADALGALDEAQATIGLARAEADPGSELHDALTELCHHLYVLMAEVATAVENRHKLADGKSRVTAEMVQRLESLTDAAAGRFPPLTEFVIPGQTRRAALLDLARTVVRRAERRAVTVALEGSQVVPYLNRASSLLWALARADEALAAGTLLARDAST